MNLLTKRSLNSNNLKPERTEFLQKWCFLATPSKCQRKARVCKESVICPYSLTWDAMFLRVGASQRTIHVDEVSINMENNARLKDSLGA
ncbi:hypothetical protein AMECASPLE_014152 [Ameca splendens]|uniref:Uncharacterized protein n=1 Tax=Ameca splendens TaxID=208324 RepID=A0ABV0YNI8_9TELE